MERIVIEVGSTCTKVDRFDGKQIVHLATTPIQFKRHYLDAGKLLEEDINDLITLVNNINSDDVYVCGTSVFRTLKQDEKEQFITRFENETNKKFNIIDQEQENVLTVQGATKHVEEAMVFVGGGGSTEISFFKDGKIQEMKNNKIGVSNVLKEYPNLGEDLATSSLEEIKAFISERLEIPDVKTDILILAGGGHEYFARNSGVRYKNNTLYTDKYEPIYMDIESRIEDTKRYYTEISLDEIRSRVKEPEWWYATRAMCAFVLVVAEKIGAKYIVPTDVSMIHGIVLDK